MLARIVHSESDKLDPDAASAQGVGNVGVIADDKARAGR
jgi:hypothetical protein